MSLEDLITEISKKTNLSASEVNNKINLKYEEFTGMITREGAAHLLAKEFGINLQNSSRRPLQIKNIVAGIRNVDLVGRVFKISAITQFERNNKEGKVVNIFIGDSTGFIRLPLWNDQVKIVEEELVKIGDLVHVSGAFAKENNFGEIEISLGKFGNLRPVEESIDLPTADELSKKYLSNFPQQVKIKDLVPGNFEISGIVVKVFQSKFLFNDNGEQAMFVSCLVDDGTENIRVTFFRDAAEKISNTNAKVLSELPEEDRLKIIEKNSLGKEIVISGKVKKSPNLERLEMIANSVKDINPLDVSKKLVEVIEIKTGA